MARSQQPNIVLSMADQLAPHFTGAYDHPVVKTPHMDALVMGRNPPARQGERHRLAGL